MKIDPMQMSTPTSAEPEKKSGLLHWAKRVVEECEKASHDFAADPVHDLRVAIRRCRSMADGFLSVDPDPGWKQMKRMAKPLFVALGDLRDVQVMMEWVGKLSAEGDPARGVLLQELQGREDNLKEVAKQELAEFDREHWLALNVRLSARAEKAPLDGTVFQLLALERWREARELHRKALHNRSGVAYHQLRIGIKRLRYTVENFLPTLHERWSKDLRSLQDALGEAHDFDVLWAMVRSHHEVPHEVRLHWRTVIQTERNKRLLLYREKMVGRRSLWNDWRAALPSGDGIRRAGVEKLRLWASFLDPHFEHTARITSVALGLYDGLVESKVLRADGRQRSLLEVAALTHEIGISGHEHGHRKRSSCMIRKMPPPPDWSAQDMQSIAVIVRYQRGGLLPMSHPMFGGIPARSRAQVLRLAGILRLAVALDDAAKACEFPPAVSRKDGVIVIATGGLDAHVGPAGERLARAKYLLEATCRVPVKLESSRVSYERPKGQSQEPASV
jgi:CHAD domain-containing protein